MYRSIQSKNLVLVFLLTGILSSFFIAFPQIDLYFSTFFYDPINKSFIGYQYPIFRYIRSLGLLLPILVLLFLLLTIVVKFIGFKANYFLSINKIYFLVLSLLIPNGLIINLVLKEFWGRARPRNIHYFGSDLEFTTAWQFSSQCVKNCSFVSGEASSAIWLTSLYFICLPQYKKPALSIGLVLMVLFSFNRITMGAHFLSDIVISWGITLFFIFYFQKLLLDSPHSTTKTDYYENQFQTLKMQSIHFLIRIFKNLDSSIYKFPKIFK